MLLPGAELQLLSQVPSPPHSTGLVRLSGGACVWLEPCRGSSAACKSHVGKSSPWPSITVQFLGEGRKPCCEVQAQATSSKLPKLLGLRVRHTQQGLASSQMGRGRQESVGLSMVGVLQHGRVRTT